MAQIISTNGSSIKNIPSHHRMIAYTFQCTRPISIRRFRQVIEQAIEKCAPCFNLITDQNESSFGNRALKFDDIANWTVTSVTADKPMRVILQEEYRAVSCDEQQGRVFRCCLLKFSTDSMQESPYLMEGDLILFTFHRNIVNDAVFERFFDEMVTGWQMSCLENHLSNGFHLKVNGHKTQQDSMKDQSGSLIKYIDQQKIVCLNQFLQANNLDVIVFWSAMFQVFLFRLSNDEERSFHINADASRNGHLDTRFTINPDENFLQLCCRLQPLFSLASRQISDPYSLEILELPDGSLSIHLYDIPLLHDEAYLSLALDDDVMLKRVQLDPCGIHLLDNRSSLCIRSTPADNEVCFSVSRVSGISETFTTADLLNRFELLFEQVFSDVLIKHFCLLLPEETRIINDLNDTSLDLGHVGCIHSHIAEQVQQHPQKLALTLNDASMTYAELWHHAQMIADHLIEEHQIKVGQVVCQLMERSFELVIGILGILLSGGVYAPLSPREPVARLNTCIQQTSSHLLLMHPSTMHIKLEGCPVIDITHFIHNAWDKAKDISYLEKVAVTGENISHIVFTSGSTGIPKTVQIRHRNFVSYIRSYIFEPSYIVLQHTSVTFDAHVGEILGATMTGCQVVLVPPNLHLDMDALSTLIQDKNLTYLGTVPSQINELTVFLDGHLQKDRLKSLRCISMGGEALYSSTVIAAKRYLHPDCLLYNYYGPAECTESVIKHQVTEDDLRSPAIPIGRPIPNTHIYLLDEYLQPVIPGHQMGEIVIGGAGVFAGYLGRPDLDQQAFCKMNDELCYRSGDLARFNLRTRALEYCGRRDHQVKLRGQRIELGEIESLIMQKANMCVVVKTSHNDQDHLVAYVEGRGCDEDGLRRHCSSHLPLYMVPSYFVIMDKLPLNQNGKIDRKALPMVDFSSQSRFSSDDASANVATDMERKVFEVWREFLPHLRSMPPVTTSFFELGGNSLLLMRVFRLYQEKVTTAGDLQIIDIFQHASIHEHAVLLESRTSSMIPTVASSQSSQQLEGVASSAQTRIFLDEQTRFGDQSHIAIYNIVLPLEVQGKSGVSISRLRVAMEAVIQKHAVLRTCVALTDDNDRSTLRQNVLKNISYPLEISTMSANDFSMDEILYNEETNRSLFSVDKGQVFRCHIIRFSEKVSDPDLLISGDLIIFNFHHIAFDGTSVDVFLDDLARAYCGQEIGVLSFSYIDYAINEKQTDWRESESFWKNQLETYHCSRLLDLPYDRKPDDLKVRSGKSYRASFELSADLVNNITLYMHDQHVTLFQLGLAMLYGFLFKLAGEDDLCIATTFENRLRPQEAQMIGFFVNTVPYRLIIDPKQSFNSLLQRIKSLFYNILPHASFPYQNIMRNDTFVQNMLLVEDIDETGVVTLDNEAYLQPIIQHKNTDTYNIFDIEYLIRYSTKNQSIEITLQGSADLFNAETILSMSQRFEYLIRQLFSNLSLCQFSLLLPDETRIINDLNDTSLDLGHVGCIHSHIAEQVQQHPQKLALTLNDASMTYAELWHHAQMIADHLIEEHQIKVGQVVCQLMERSFELVIGILGILLSGGVYAPLSPREPVARLNSCIEKTSSHLLLVHSSTKHIQILDCTVVDIAICIQNLSNKAKTLFHLDSVQVTGNNISHIVFTSGSTGVPKLVQLRHRNLVSYMKSYLMKREDIVLNHTPVTFDVHVEEILGTLIIGAQLVITPPEGHLDMEILSRKIHDNGVTYLCPVPSQILELNSYLDSQRDTGCLRSVRCIAIGGDSLFSSAIIGIRRHVKATALIYNTYGPAECTETATTDLVTEVDLLSPAIPIGRPIPNTHIYLLDEHLQPVIPGHQMGEIVIGGAGVFAGYLGRPDLDQQVFCKINDELCYRSGDLARFNLRTRALEYCGRRDHQVKLRGQRIELGEIESLIMQKANMCVVVKTSHNDQDHLVAYVEGQGCDEDGLRRHCSSHLPLYMVPSYFVIMDKLPLNQNGKIDRKALPMVDFSSQSRFSSDDAGENVATDMERKVFEVWREFLPHLRSMPAVTTSFFELGGNSLLLMKVHRQYKKAFPDMDVKVFDLFRKPRIKDHAQLICHRSSNIDKISEKWNHLSVKQGLASYAQTSIWLAERVRYREEVVSVYNLPWIMKIESGYLSIERCMDVVKNIVARHWILRTRLVFDTEKNCLIQIINDEHQPLMNRWTYRSVEEKDSMVEKAINRPFKTNDEGVFRWHLIQSWDAADKNHLSTGDIIIFDFHHGSFDGQAVDLFVEQFKQAYEGKELQTPELQYIDYSIHERRLIMTEAKKYWHGALKDYGWNRQLVLHALPQTFTSSCRSEKGSIFQMEIPSIVGRSILAWAARLHTSLFQLGLTCFYVFLSQISAHNRDACIGVNHLNRYHPCLTSMIGMFVNVLPCRIKIDGLESLSFVSLAKRVQELFLESAQYSYLPYDQIIDLHRSTTSDVRVPFLPAIFRVDVEAIDYKYSSSITLSDSCRLSSVNIANPEVGGYHFDLQVSLMYDKAQDEFATRWYYLTDAFDKSTIQSHATNFVNLMSQLFGEKSDIRLNLPLKEVILFNEKSDSIDQSAPTAFRSNKTHSDLVESTELIDQIRQTFAKVLNQNPTMIDLEKSFFEQGGTSLKLIQLMVLLKRDLLPNITIEQISFNSSILELAASVAH